MRKPSFYLIFLFLFCGSTVFSQVISGNPLNGLDQLQAGRRHRSSSADLNWKNGNGDARGIAPGETLTIADLTGPGRITHIWFTIAAEDPYYGRSVTLRMYWDGEKEPGVESPLGDFFAAGHGIKADINSMPVQVSSEGRAYNCYWPMPFKKSARITVTNDSKKYKVHAFFWYVDWLKVSKLPEKTAYFHAQYRQEFPCVSGRNYLIFHGEGEGQYVGTVLSVHMNGASWFGEGDDLFYIDGEKEPSLRGTGTEDYFCDAWGFRRFTNLYYGVSIWEGFDVDDHGTAYRWHIPDPIPFKKSLKVVIEHKGVTFQPVKIVSKKPLNVPVFSGDTTVKPEDGESTRYIYTFDGDKVKSGFEERPDYFSSVAFWYQRGPAIRFATLPPAEERLVLGDVIEAEDVFEFTKANPEKVMEVQKGGQWSGGRQLFYHPVETDKAPVLNLSFEIKESARYILKLFLSHSWDYGIFKIDLDGKTIVDSIDLYSAQCVVKVKKLGVRTLKKGRHTLTFTCIGSNIESKVESTGAKGRYIGIDKIYLRKVPAFSVQKVKVRRASKKKSNENSKIK